MGKGGRRWRWFGHTARANYPSTITSKAAEPVFLKWTRQQEILQDCGSHDVRGQ